MSSDFSKRPFVAGSLIGLRAFDVDPLGRLVGPSYAQIFRPGENQASCYVMDGVRIQQQALLRAPRKSSGLATSEPVLPAAEVRPEHWVGNVNCGCGFYAYFDGTNTYAQRDRVTAIIEGYGVCTVGDRGFRAERARLVALVNPGARRGSRIHAAFDHTADWCIAHEPWFVPAGTAALFAGVGVGACAGVASSWLWSPILTLLAVALVAAFVWVLKASLHGIDRQYPDVSPNTERCAVPPRRGIGAASFAAIAANYPDVPVYPSVKAALDAHPLTPPEPEPLPSPETHEDFWSMEVPR